MDYKTLTEEQLQQLTDEDLETLRANMLAELDRRNKLRDIPNDICKMANDYEDLGGNKSELITVINEADMQRPEVKETEQVKEEKVTEEKL